MSTPLKPKKHRSNTTDEHVEKVRELVKSGECVNITAACRKLGYSYHSFIAYISEEVKGELWTLARSSQLGVPLPIVSNDVKELPPSPAVWGMEFPKTIVKLTRNSINTSAPKKLKLRFFLRVEMEKYWVGGYEYEVPGSNGKYQSDSHLYEISQDLRDIVIKLRKNINDRLDHDTLDEELGAVRYALTDEEEVDLKKCVKSNSFVDVPDGSYQAVVSGDIGRLTNEEGTMYQFALSENVPKADCLVTVQNKIVFVYL